ncbi:hypothetical protein Tco_0793221 [Tanacetum coccineum]
MFCLINSNILLSCKEYELGLLRTKLEKVKQEKEGVDFKIAKFDKTAKDLNEMLESQITDKSKKGVGYNVVPSPQPLILNRPITLDLSYSGHEEFKEPEVNEYSPRDSSLKPTTGCDKESDNSKENTDDSLEQHQMTDTETSSFESVNQIEKKVKRTVRYADKSLVEEQVSHVKSSSVEGCKSNTSKIVNEVEPKKNRENNDAPIIEDWVSDDEDEDEPNLKFEKKTVIPTATKKEFVKPKKPVKRSVRPRVVNTARSYRTPVNTVRPRVVNTARPNRTSVNAARENSNSQLNDKGFVDSGCLERISKKKTKNEAKTTKLDTEWKSVEKTQSSQSPSVKKSTQVNLDKPEAKSQEKQV